MLVECRNMKNVIGWKSYTLAYWLVSWRRRQKKSWLIKFYCWWHDRYFYLCFQRNPIEWQTHRILCIDVRAAQMYDHCIAMLISFFFVNRSKTFWNAMNIWIIFVVWQPGWHLLQFNGFICQFWGIFALCGKIKCSSFTFCRR